MSRNRWSSVRSSLSRERSLQRKMFGSPNTKIARQAGMAKTKPEFGPRTFGWPYLTIDRDLGGSAEAEIVVLRSRFLAHVARAETSRRTHRHRGSEGSPSRRPPPLFGVRARCRCDAAAQ